MEDVLAARMEDVLAARDSNITFERTRKPLSRFLARRDHLGAGNPNLSIPQARQCRQPIVTDRKKHQNNLARELRFIWSVRGVYTTVPRTFLRYMYAFV